MARKAPENLPELLDAAPVVAGPGGFKRRPALGTARGIRRELAAVYLELRRGAIDLETAKASGFLLRTLLEAVRTDEIERRIDALENRKE